MPDFLSGLNPEQHKAVTLPRQSALILAGAGSGKTRVLTARIAYLIQSGQVSPSGILAVTFTNKASKEMVARLSAMLPINTRGMWIGTFHGLCNRMLRAHHRDAGLPQLFQILDSADQLSVVKRLAKAQNLDEEKFPPRQLQYFINNCKEHGLRAKDVEKGDEFTARMVAFYADYDAQCNKEGIVDFAELLLRSYELLAKNLPLLTHYQERFRFILVDEFQDTSELQYKWIKLLAGSNGAVFGVGDDDQCLEEGTLVRMADGRQKPIEEIEAGDKVLSSYGSGAFRPAEVTAVTKRRSRGDLVELRTLGGRKLRSTPEHTHFAGYMLGESPQNYFTYLMFKKGVGYRIGTTQVYTRGQARPMLGYKQRALQEHADALWVIGTHASENESRFQEISLSLKYALPTLPFVPRKGKALNGLVHDAAWISRLYRELDTAASAKRLLGDLGLDPDRPHHLPQSRDSNRRNVTVTLCGDRRGATPMHRISVMGNDPEGREALVSAGFSVRPAKIGSRSWRFETVRKDFGELLKLCDRASGALGGASLVQKANLAGKAIPFIAASSVRPGMMMVTDDGSLDVVTSVARVEGRGRAVWDINVASTHNFIAGGIVTHNSIYAFRNARVGNMQDFKRDFAIDEVIKLEQNYRSQGNILDAANAVIAQNKARLGKNLWTEASKGEPIRIFAAATDEEEAQFIVDEVKALHREGMALADMALLYRSNAQSRILEHALFRAAIGYRVYGGQRFFERQEIKHALAYVRLAANPGDDTAFTRVVNFPPRGIGARSVEQLQQSAEAMGVSLMQAAKSGGGVTGRSGTAIAGFVQLVDQLRQSAAKLTLAELMDEVLVRSTLRAHYAAERDGQDRLENLNELVTAATLFAEEFEKGEIDPAPVAEGQAEPTAQEAMLTAFLSHASLEAGEHEAAAGQDALQLMTVHSAKGLEFHAVFISGLEEGLFPHENSLKEDGGPEEERRLMYVAITRARQRLYVSYAGVRMLHGQPRYGIVSRFVEEIPRELTRWIVLPEKAAPAWTPPQRNWGQSPVSGARRGMAAPPVSEFADLTRPIAGKRPDEHPFAIGQNVQHAKFGEGVVINFEGRGLDARVQVRFRSEGTKWLALQYAKLQPA
jgi:DNA helicase-2/ATP-dependent DNA helicase PcrA